MVTAPPFHTLQARVRKPGEPRPTPERGSPAPTQLTGAGGGLTLFRDLSYLNPLYPYAVAAPTAAARRRRQERSHIPGEPRICGLANASPNEDDLHSEAAFFRRFIDSNWWQAGSAASPGVGAKNAYPSDPLGIDNFARQLWLRAAGHGGDFR